MRSKPAAIALVLTVVLLAGCQGSVLDAKGPIAAGNAKILLNSLAVMLVIVIPTLIALVLFAWRYRASNDTAVYDPEFIYSGRIELIVWSIPTLTILFLGGLIYYGSHELDPAKPIVSDRSPLEVEVIALDWKWLFLYPQQGFASVNELVIPAGVSVHFRLTSASVMNAFFIPQLGSMIYAMNGMQTDLNLRADTTGVYRGLSAHFSGDGFSDMNFAARAVTSDVFTAWAADVRKSAAKLDKAAYGALARPSGNQPVIHFGAVEPGLFDAVLHQSPAPSPSPQGEPDRSRNIRPEAGSASVSGAHRSGGER